ncbi:hypothetical protein OE88DRAFT_827141 [Heliocybe sulcata]|uniref:Uncharacterized protein n=1 Tax=Heliocybe sulcata TaxID=5364 RepID=A0A5C3MPJ9_9AGAM|nr:hypothetical protein OE88DRAFT_827141 [Heliocybe sulcata]
MQIVLAFASCNSESHYSGESPGAGTPWAVIVAQIVRFAQAAHLSKERNRIAAADSVLSNHYLAHHATTQRNPECSPDTASDTQMPTRYLQLASCVRFRWPDPPILGGKRVISVPSPAQILASLPACGIRWRHQICGRHYPTAREGSKYTVRSEQGPRPLKGPGWQALDDRNAM